MKRFLFFFCFFLPLIYHAGWLGYGISRLYQFAYISQEYNYSELNHVQEFSFGKKVLGFSADVSDEVQQFFESPDKEHWKWLAGSKKHGNGVGRVQIEDKPYIVKWSHEKGFWRQLFLMNKAVLIWNHAKKAVDRGLPIAKPIAFSERRGWNYSDGMVLFEDRSSKLEFPLELSQVNAILDKLAEHRLIHHDLNPRNLVNEEGTIKLIDLDYLHSYPPFAYAWHIRYDREEARLRGLSSHF